MYRFKEFFWEALASIIIIGIFTAFFSSCATKPLPPVKPPIKVPVPTAPKEPEVKAKFKGNWDNADYDKYLEEAIEKHGQNLMAVTPKDKDKYSNAWKNTKEFKLNFYSALIVAMAKKESNWKTETSYRENFKDQRGKYVISRGLLQLSIESGRGYKCPFDDAQDIHNPKLNLECGVIILDRWLGRDGYIGSKVYSSWKGGARYWSVLRGTKLSPKSTTNYIISETKKIK